MKVQEFIATVLLTLFIVMMFSMILSTTLRSYKLFGLCCDQYNETWSAVHRCGVTSTNYTLTNYTCCNETTCSIYEKESNFERYIMSGETKYGKDMVI